jgi:Mg/Co/Ni transporter MgtE
MRNIAEIIEDDRNGKQLSQTERQIAVAYIQGKYDAVKELKISNSSNTNEIINKIRDEILDNAFSVVNPHDTYEYINVIDLDSIDKILDKYKAESEE